MTVQYSLDLSPPAFWRLREVGPIEAPIPGMPGWALVTPALLDDERGWGALERVAAEGGQAIVSSTDLRFSIDAEDEPVLPEQLLPIVRWLRFVTGQVTLVDAVIAGRRTSAQAPMVDVRVFEPSMPIEAVLAPVRLTAISLEDIALASSRAGASLSVPVYADTLLDAIGTARRSC